MSIGSALLAPESHFLLLGTADAEFSHLLVTADLRIGKLTVLAEDDVEAEADDAEGHDGQSDKVYHVVKLLTRKSFLLRWIRSCRHIS